MRDLLAIADNGVAVGEGLTTFGGENGLRSAGAQKKIAGAAIILSPRCFQVQAIQPRVRHDGKKSGRCEEEKGTTFLPTMIVAAPLPPSTRKWQNGEFYPLTTAEQKTRRAPSSRWDVI